MKSFYSSTLPAVLCIRRFFLAFSLISGGTSLAHAIEGNPLTGVGDLIPDFTLFDFNTGEPVSREDFAGGILVIDFCAWWCGPCQLSSPGLRNLIEAYYLENGGNPAGLPVHVVTIDVTRGEYHRETERFVKNLRLNRFLTDTPYPGLIDLMPGENSNVPYFAIISGVADYPDHQQWELLYYSIGYSNNDPFIDEMRPVIDAVTGTPPPDAPQFFLDPFNQTVHEGQNTDFFLGFSGKAPLTVRWYRDGELIPGQDGPILRLDAVTTAQSGSYHAEVENDHGMAVSRTALFRVTQRFGDWIQLAGLSGDDAIPQADPDGDGHNNFSEYVQGTDPNDGTSFYIPTIEKASDTETLKVDFQINSGILGAQYSIETSTDLRAWLPYENEDNLSVTTRDSRLTLSAAYPWPSTELFWRLNIADPRTDLSLREGETIAGELNEADAVVPKWFNQYGEIYYYDPYTLNGLEEGVEYSITLFPEDYAFSPYIELHTPSSGEDALAVAFSNSQTVDFEKYSTFTFIADSSLEYIFYASSYNQESTGNYLISLERTSDFTPLVFNEPKTGKFDYDLDHNGWESFYELAHTYRLRHLPAGQQISVYLEALEELIVHEEGARPYIELRDARTLEYFFSSSRLEDVPGEPGKQAYRITFVPNDTYEYVLTASTTGITEPFDFEIRVSATHRFPAIQPGDEVSGFINQAAVWTFDDIQYHISFYQLTNVAPDQQVHLEITTETGEDIRLFVMDAADWNFLYKDLPDQVGQSESLLFVPQTGKNYFIGAAVPKSEEETDYTLSVSQE